MLSAIEQIVSVYVSLRSRQRLEDMRLQRERAVLDLKSNSDYDMSMSVRQLEEEIAVIDAGLQKLA
jgi:hypothetical protein